MIATEEEDECIVCGGNYNCDTPSKQGEGVTRRRSLY